jgi:Methyltransferase domain
MSFLRRVLRRHLGPTIDGRSRSRGRQSISTAIPIAGGAVQSIEICDSGLLAARGWARDLTAFERALQLRLGDDRYPPSHTFRVPRPDLEQESGGLGAVAEWTIAHAPSPRPASLLVDGRDAVSLTIPPVAYTPYAHLHTHPLVLGRRDIYGVGAPVHVVSDEVLALARRLPPPILDFGCGGGALLLALRREGIEAYGLELDQPRIQEHLLADVRPLVTLYDGRCPSPLANGQFASVVCSEVLEHLPDVTAAVDEIARLATRALLVTVPDMSAIPRGFAHGVVPWHLLEATHVNFFTQHSLAAVLAGCAGAVEFTRIGQVRCDRMSFYTGLAAVATLSPK